jgi:hypothetical protein
MNAALRAYGSVQDHLKIDYSAARWQTRHNSVISPSE